MSSKITFVEVRDDLHPILGKPEKGTRFYKRKGAQEEVGHWYDVLSATVGPTVSPGGVRMYVPVTRAAIHERIERGRLSLFEFDVVNRVTNLFGTSKTVQERPYTFVPISECRGWRAEIEERAKARGISPEEIDRAKPGWLDDFLAAVKDEEEQPKKTLPAELAVPFTKDEFDRIATVAQRMKYGSPGELVAALLKPIIAGGFSGLSFTRAGWWMSGQMEKHGVGEVPLPKFLEKLRRKK